MCPDGKGVAERGPSIGDNLHRERGLEAGWQRNCFIKIDDAFRTRAVGLVLIFIYEYN